MPSSPFRSEQLSAQHPRGEFTCGVEALDRYLRQQATQDLRRGLAVPYALIDATTDAIAGYYTLSGFAFDATVLPDAERRRVGRYPLVPAVIIGRLARDVRYRGQGVGGLLLVDACRRVQGLARDLGTWGMIVDAKDDAARRFYEHFGFTQTVDDEHRLFLPVRSFSGIPGVAGEDTQ